VNSPSAVTYADRWQYDKDMHDRGLQPTCDTCQTPVAPISVGWAHAHNSADDLVLNFGTQRHIPTVLGHAT
jgi:hypothetical protein